MRLFKVKRVISSTLGELPLKEGGGKFTPSGFNRETQNAEVHENIGFVESATPASLELTLNAAIDPQDFRNIDNDNLTIFLDGGAQHMMPAAWVTEAVGLDAGEISVTYNSAKSERLT